LTGGGFGAELLGSLPADAIVFHHAVQVAVLVGNVRKVRLKRIRLGKKSNLYGSPPSPLFRYFSHYAPRCDLYD